MEEFGAPDKLETIEDKKQFAEAEMQWEIEDEINREQIELQKSEEQKEKEKLIADIQKQIRNCFETSIWKFLKAKRGDTEQTLEDLRYIKSFTFEQEDYITDKARRELMNQFKNWWKHKVLWGEWK